MGRIDYQILGVKGLVHLLIQIKGGRFQYQQTLNLTERYKKKTVSLINSMLSCVCSVIDHRWHRDVAGTKKELHEAQPIVSLMFLLNRHVATWKLFFNRQQKLIFIDWFASIDLIYLVYILRIFPVPLLSRCSSYESEISRLGIHAPVRVCHSCYKKLKKASKKAKS